MTNELANTSSTPEPQRLQHDYILLDGSSSMRDNWWNTLAAIDAYVATTKAQNVKSQVILHTFDSRDRDCVQRNVDIDTWVPFSVEAVGSHWGTTPLYDAVNLMGRRLRDLDPPRCSIVIVTDGEENASSFTDLTQAKSILDWCRAKGWQITFIGANFDNSEQAALLGADKNSAIGVHQHRLVYAATALAKKRARYGLYGEPMHYTDSEQQQFGGFLSGPSKEHP